MYKIVEKEKITDIFGSDTLSFEELQELNNTKEKMMKGEYYTFNEVFDEL